MPDSNQKQDWESAAKTAQCECGYTVSDADIGRLAELMRRHIAEAHPDNALPSVDRLRFNIAKSRMYGAGTTTIFRLLPRRDPE